MQNLELFFQHFSISTFSSEKELLYLLQFHETNSTEISLIKILNIQSLVFSFYQYISSGAFNVCNPYY